MYKAVYWVLQLQFFSSKLTSIYTPENAIWKGNNPSWWTYDHHGYWPLTNCDDLPSTPEIWQVSLDIGGI